MFNTEMVIFSANGDQSSVTTYSSAEETDPVLQPELQSCYDPVFNVNDDGTVTIYASRPLDCGVEDSYVIELDKQLQLITAWNTKGPELSYHEGDKFGFNGFFASDGTCTDPAANPCLTKINDGGSFTVSYVEADDVISMNATIPDKSYAGWGWGGSMTNTEMLIFSADGDNSDMETYYGVGDTEPEKQKELQSCYTTIPTKKDNGYVEFITTRPVDCGISNSYVVQTDTLHELITAWNSDGPSL